MSDRFHRSTKYFLIFILLVFFGLIATSTCVFAETTQVTLAWDDINDPVPDGYRVYQRLEGQPYDYSQPVATSSDSTVTVYNLDFDATYYFVVRAYAGADESGDSNEVAFFAPSSSSLSYTILASTSGNGTLSPAGEVTVTEGNDQTFNIFPDTGSYIVDVIIDGVSVGVVSTYTFTQVTANHTIAAEFAPTTYSIHASSDSGGSISPAGTTTVDLGASAGYTITPAAGYQVKDVVVDGTPMGPLTTYQFDQVVQDHTIHATFAADTFTISSTADTNGTITPSGSTAVSSGSNQTYSISPKDGYSIADVTVDGASVGIVDTYTFSNIQSDHTISALFVADNQSPVPDAGPDQTVDEGQTVTLSGLNSFDTDDGIANHEWRQVQGIAVALSSPTEPETTFTAPDVDASGGALVFELMVTDYSGATAIDSCIVNVTWVNVPPTADAGADQTVEEGAQVLLDATNSTDSDDGIVAYAWRQSLGPVVQLSNANSATPTFIAPNVALEGASLTFEVTVTDAGGLQDTNTCLINVSWVNTPPVADAGPDQNAATGDEVLLDGAQSYDTDDIMITSFMWRQTEGAPVQLSDATARQPIFSVPAGVPEGSVLIFELTVTDSGGLQGTDSCQVKVNPVGPIVYASKITMTLSQKGPNYQAQAYVTVLDDTGSIVKQADVTGQWTLNGASINVASTATRGDGTARLDSDKINVKPGDILTFEIIDISNKGYTYNPSANTVTKQSLSVP